MTYFVLFLARLTLSLMHGTVDRQIVHWPFNSGAVVKHCKNIHDNMRVAGKGAGTDWPDRETRTVKSFPQ